MPATVLQRALRYYPSLRHVRARRRHGTPRAASWQADNRAFLNQVIDDIPLFETQMLKVQTSGLCDRLLRSYKRLCELTGEEADISSESSLENTIAVLEKIEKWAEQHKVMFTAVKDADDEVQFYLSHNVSCLEYSVFFFYASPAVSLPGPTASLYKRFIAFLAASLGISVMPEHSDNRYLDMMLNLDDEAFEDEYPDKISLYQKDENVRMVFEEIRDSDIKGLKEDLLAHRRMCDTQCLDIVDSMIAGMDILPYMYVDNYMFNPYDDGFDGYDETIDLMSTLAILYSSKDGMEDSIIESINNDTYCGLMPQGWNRWLLLSPETTLEELNSLMADDGNEKMFVEWNQNFYSKCEKWDNYSKSINGTN